MWIRCSVINQMWWLSCCLLCKSTNICPWFVPWTTYALCGTGCWLTHVVGHCKRSGAWYRFHTLGHHVRSYPPARFLQSKYVSYESRRRKMQCNPYIDMNTLMYAPWVPVAAGIHAACGVQDAGTLIVSLATGSIFLLQQDYIHTHIHLLGSWLERYEWFQQLRHMHLKHHQSDMNHNFGVNDFLLDAVAGTLLL